MASKIDQVMGDLKNGKLKQEDMKYVYNKLNAIYRHEDYTYSELNISYPLNLIDVISGGLYNPVDITTESLLYDRMEYILSLLPDQEKLVIKHIFKDNMTLEEVGKELKLSKERIRQIEYKAIRKLHHPKYYNMLFDEFDLREQIKKREKVNKELSLSLFKKIYELRTKLDAIDKVLKSVGVDIMNTKDNDILSSSIEELELSVRSYNCLKRAGINTIAELINTSITELNNVRNLGQKGVDEISEKLADIGYILKEDKDD